MSLEESLQNPAAMLARTNELLEQLIQVVSAPRAEIAAVVEESAKPEPKKAKAKKEATVEARPLEPSAPSTGSGATDASVTEAAAAPAVSRQDVSVALTMVSAKKGRDASMQILKQVGAASLKAAQESDYPAILCACELALI